MKQKLHLSRIVFSFFLVITSLGIVLGIAEQHRGVDERSALIATVDENPGVVSSQNLATFDKYLPAGAILSRPVALADLEGDGRQEAVLFYTVRNQQTESRAGILVLQPKEDSYLLLWEKTYELSSGFADLTGIYDLNNNGKHQIVAYRVVGASCPGILDIFQSADGTFENIGEAWAGSCQSDLEIKDVDGDGSQEVIFKALKSGVNRDIYRWSGKRYVRSNRKYAENYNDDLANQLKQIYAHSPYPAYARASWCKAAVQIYLYQKRYREALQLCGDVLQMLRDSTLTIPNSEIRGEASPEQQDRVKRSLDADRTKAQASIHRLRGDIYKAAGNLRQSQDSYRTALQLEKEAAQKAMALMH